MIPLMRRLAFVLVFAMLALHSPTAGADVAPPAPPCPRGMEPIHGHGISKCVYSAPKNCPAGWRGELGDQCVPATCEGSCDSGLECFPVTLCVTTSRGAYSWQANGVVEGIVGAGVPCDSGRVEKPGGVCAAKGNTPIAFVPSSTQRDPRRAPRKPATLRPPAPAASVPPPATSAPPPPSGSGAALEPPDAAPVDSSQPEPPQEHPMGGANPPPAQRTSCGACGMGSTAGAVPAGILAAWLVAAWGLRRAKKGRGA